jgi:hypothetical protein
MALLQPEGRRKVGLPTGEHTLITPFWMIPGIMAIDTRDPRGRRRIENEGRSIGSEGDGVIGPRRMKLKITPGDSSGLGGWWGRGICVRRSSWMEM